MPPDLLLGYSGERSSTASKASGFATLTVNDKQITLDLKHLSTIQPRPALVRIPGAAWWISGVDASADSTLLVISLAAYLDEKPSNCDGKFVAVIDSESLNVGVLADAVTPQADSNAVQNADALAVLLDEQGLLSPDKLHDLIASGLSQAKDRDD